MKLYTRRLSKLLLNFWTHRATLKVILRKRLSDEIGLEYSSGDHVGIIANNRPELVEAILRRLVIEADSLDAPIQLQLLQEKYTPMGNCNIIWE